MQKNKVFSAGRIVLACFFFLIISSVILEFSFRFFHYKTFAAPQEAFIYNRDCGYLYNPKQIGFEGGFRGGVPVKKNSNERRILCIGESITSGDFIPVESKTWPQLLEKRLNEKKISQNWKVFNGAIGGFGTQHILKMLETKIDLFDPDVVIIYAGAGGNGLVDGSLWVPYPVAKASDSWIARMDKFFYQHLTIYRCLLRYRFHNFLTRFAGVCNARGDCFHSHDYEGVLEDIRKIVLFVKSKNVVPVVIAFPIWKEKANRMLGSQAADTLQFIVQRISEIGEKTKSAHFDMRQIFRDTNEPENFYFYDYLHIKPEGCDRFSKAIADSLTVNKIIW